MKALLLAGGFGTRLRPLTYTRPKHLLPIVNRPHIEHVFDLLQRHAIHDAVLLTSYLAERFDATVARAASRGMRLEVTHEAEPLGTAGALKNAESLVGDDSFLAFNGDVLSDVDLGTLIAFHREREATATILLTPVEDPSAFGVVPTDDRGRVEAFIEKPAPGTAPTNMINAGVYVLEPGALELVPEGEVWSAERQLFPALVDRGAMYALPSDAYWADIGTPEKYLQANVDALSGTYRTDLVPDPGPDANALDPSARVDDSAELAHAAIGSNAIVGDGARVHRSVLLPGAVVGERARVVEAILGEGAQVPAGAEARGVTLADGEVAGDDAGTPEGAVGRGRQEG